MGTDGRTNPTYLKALGELWGVPCLKSLMDHLRNEAIPQRTKAFNVAFKLGVVTYAEEPIVKHML